MGTPDQYDAALITSPPSRVIKAVSVWAETELVKKWTAPSTKRVFAPPGWLLEIPHVPRDAFPRSPVRHGQVGSIRIDGIRGVVVSVQRVDRVGSLVVVRPAVDPHASSEVHRFHDMNGLGSPIDEIGELQLLTFSEAAVVLQLARTGGGREQPIHPVHAVVVDHGELHARIGQRQGVRGFLQSVDVVGRRAKVSGDDRLTQGRRSRLRRSPGPSGGSRRELPAQGTAGSWRTLPGGMARC